MLKRLVPSCDVSCNRTRFDEDANRCQVLINHLKIICNLQRKLRFLCLEIQRRNIFQSRSACRSDNKMYDCKNMCVIVVLFFFCYFGLSLYTVISMFTLTLIYNPSHNASIFIFIYCNSHMIFSFVFLSSHIQLYK